jgi:hypothetical protein
MATLACMEKLVNCLLLGQKYMSAYRLNYFSASCGNFKFKGDQRKDKFGRCRSITTVEGKLEARSCQTIDKALRLRIFYLILNTRR